MEPAVAKALGAVAHAPAETLMLVEAILKGVGLLALFEWLAMHPAITAAAVLIVAVSWFKSSRSQAADAARKVGAPDQTNRAHAPQGALIPDPTVATADTRDP